MAVNANNITTSITLDTSQFDKAIANATAKLSKLEKASKELDKSVKSNQEAINENQKSINSLARGYSSVERSLSANSKSIKELTRDVTLNDGATARLSARLEEIAGRATRSRAEIDALRHINKQYGDTLDALNPILQRARKTEEALSKSRARHANSGADAELKRWQDRQRIVTDEIELNKKSIASRQAMALEYEKVAKRLQQAQANAEKAMATNHGRTDSKSVNRYNSASEKFALAQQELAQAKKIHQSILDSINALQARNKTLSEAQTHINSTVQAINKQNNLLQNQKKLSDDLKRNERERELIQKENAKNQQGRLKQIEQHEKRLATEREKALKRQETLAKEASRKELQARKADERELKDFTAQQLREVRLARADELRRAKEAKQAEIRLEREAQREKERLAKETLKAKTLADKQATQEAKRLAKEKAQAEREEIRRTQQAQRQAHREYLQLKRDEIQAQRQMASDVAMLGVGFGTMNGIQNGVNEIAEYQDIQDRLRAYNFSKAEFDEIQTRAKTLTKQNKFLSLTDAIQGNIDAISALGHNDPHFIEATLNDAIKNAYILRAKGYDKGTQSDVVKNLYGFIEARQQTSDAESAKKSIDLVRRMVITSGGKVTIADIETVIRNMGDTAITMSDEGYMRMLPLIEQYKTAGGGNGGGGGVAKAGTLIKMVSLLASGRSMTNRMALDMLGAGEVNENFAEGTKAEFIKVEELNKIFSNGIKNAGFKNAEMVSQDPIKAIMGMRGGILDYMMSDKQWKRFFGEREKFTYNDHHEMIDANGNTVDKKQQAEIENAAFKKFFAQSGMSNNNVTAMMTLFSEAFAQRVEHSVQTAKGTKDADALMNDLAENWHANIEILKASLQNLAIAFEPLLAKLVAVPKALSEFINGITEFANNNPSIAQIGLMTLAFGALFTSLKLGIGLFGGLFRVILGGKTSVSTLTTATTAMSGKLSSTATVVTALSNRFPLLSKAISTLASPITSIARLFGILPTSASTASGGVMSVVARLAGFLGGFAKMAGSVLFAGAMGYMLGSWIKDIQINGLTIQQHVENLFASIFSIVQRGIANVSFAWSSFVSIFTGQANNMEARLARLRQEKAEIQRMEYLNTHRATPTTALGRAEQKFIENAVASGKSVDSAKYEWNYKEKQKYFAGQTTQVTTANGGKTTVYLPNAGMNAEMNALAYEKRAEKEKKLAESKKAETAHHGPKLANGFYGDGSGAVTPQYMKKAPKSSGGGGGGSSSKAPKIPKSSGGGGSAKPHREFENKFLINFNDLKSKTKDTNIRLADLVENSSSSYEELARNEFIKLWIGGDFDDGNDPQRRKFATRAYDKNRDFTENDIDWNATDKSSGTSVRQWLDAYIAGKKLEDQKKAVTKATESLNSAEQNSISTLRLLNGELSYSRTKTQELVDEFAELERTNKEAVNSDLYKSQRDKAIALSHLSDFLTKAQELREQQESEQINLMTDSRKKVIKSAELEYRKFKQMYNLHLSELNRLRLDLIEQGKQDTKEYKEIDEALTKYRRHYDERDKIEHEKFVQSTRTKSDTLMAEWLDSSKGLEDASANFSEKFAYQLYDRVFSGEKMDIRGLIAETTREASIAHLKSAYSYAFTKMMGEGKGTDLYSIVKNLWEGKAVGSDENGNPVGNIGYVGKFLNWFRGINQAGDVIDRKTGEIIPDAQLISPKDMLAEKFKSMFGGLSPYFDVLKQKMGIFATETDGASVGLFKLSQNAIKRAIGALIEWTSSLFGGKKSEDGGFFSSLKGLFFSDKQAQQAEISRNSEEQTQAITQSIGNMTQENQKSMSNMIGSMSGAFGGILTNLISGGRGERTKTQRAGNALQGGMQAYQASGGNWYAGAVGAIAGLFAANGEAFNGNSQVHAFANGGAFTNKIYSSPTMFKFANGGSFNGLGVMGEAGPEAIMPLKRDSSGRLGVSVNDGVLGGNGVSNLVNISINVHNNGEEISSSSSGEESDEQVWNNIAGKVKIVVQQEMTKQFGVGGSLRK